MNIFALDADPVRAAHMQCNRHITKMPLETAQILCSAFEAGTAPYRKTHVNHPVSVWARASLENWDWTVAHGRALSREFCERYGRPHASEAVIEWCAARRAAAQIAAGMHLTPFAQVMPEQYRGPDAVLAYRRYYVAEKLRFAVWPAGRRPEWAYAQEVSNA